MKTIIVVKGDTLIGLATKYKTSVQELVRVNNLKSDLIFPGQVLKYGAEEKPATYKVQKGDSIRSIAQKFSIDLGKFKQINNIKNDALYIGQEVKVSLPPTASKEPSWTWPCRPWNVYNNSVGKFLDQAYLRIVGAQHPGNDINRNRRSGETADVDLGDEVYSVSKGIVVDAKFYPVWGNMVKIYHPHAKVWSVYAHLDKIYVSTGQGVDTGDIIGTIGKGAGGKYAAHLHFEIRTQDLPTPYWPTTSFGNGPKCINFIKQSYTDSVKFLLNKGAA